MCVECNHSHFFAIFVKKIIFEISSPITYYLLSRWLETTPVTILICFYFFVQKNNPLHFRNVSCLKLGLSVCEFFACYVRLPSPWPQTAAHCCEFVPIISIYLRHKQSCGKPQKLALLAQLTSTLLHLIPPYHIAHPSPCRWRYVEPLTRLQGASNTKTLNMRYINIFIWN